MFAWYIKRMVAQRQENEMDRQPRKVEPPFEMRLRAALSRVVRAQAEMGKELKGTRRELAARKA